MIVHTIRLKSTTQPVTICPLGDIQWAGDEEDLAYDKLLDHVASCLRQPTPLFVGMGDYIDFASPSNRQRLLEARLYETAQRVIAAATTDLVNDLFSRLLGQTKGKWAGLTQGHHHHPVKIRELADGTAVHEDSDIYLAKLLKAPWLDEMGVVKLVWPGGGEFTLLAFHGSGSSVFPWGPLVKLNRLMPHFAVDLMLMGHQTKKAVGEIDRLNFPGETGDIRHQTIKLVGTGGWTKGYIQGRRTYISQGAMGPVALGQPIIRLRPAGSAKAGTWDAQMTVEM